MQELKRRRLLTILAADIAGFSSMMSTDERKTLRRLNELRSLMDPIITQHGGKIVNTAGDSVLASFDSAVSALLAATAIQLEHKRFNENSGEEPIYFRIGVNIGEVEEQPNGDLLGHGVNVASRLEALAAPGGICLSENVYEQVRGKVEFDLTKAGEHFVKNIDQPIRVYAVGGVGQPLVKRIAQTLVLATRNPLFLAISAVTIGVSFILSANLSVKSLWQSKASSETEDIQTYLTTNPTPENLLKRFDLVTTGTFDGSRYHVIRTWGMEYELLQQIAQTLGGHMVSIHSAEENQFVYELTLRDEGHWMFQDDLAIGPLIGLVQLDGAKEPDGGWEWQNGEPITYTNWKPYSPDNSFGNQDYANFQGRKTTKPDPHWNDTTIYKHSFIVEVPQN